MKAFIASIATVVIVVMLVAALIGVNEIAMRMPPELRLVVGGFGLAGLILTVFGVALRAAKNEDE